ncbi:hypothetical protein BDW22DRAFT_1363328 [Trametopsis cervina]|nr:hypothetical protein BDW22DRAFT_1363328 [Trametopsis cervina]
MKRRAQNSSTLSGCSLTSWLVNCIPVLQAPLFLDNVSVRWFAQTINFRLDMTIKTAGQISMHFLTPRGRRGYITGPRELIAIFARIVLSSLPPCAECADLKQVNASYACWPGVSITGQTKQTDYAAAVDIHAAATVHSAPSTLFSALFFRRRDITMLRANAIGTERVLLDKPQSAGVLQIIQLALALTVINNEQLGAHPGMEFRVVEHPVNSSSLNRTETGASNRGAPEGMEGPSKIMPLVLRKLQRQPGSGRRQRKTLWRPISIVTLSLRSFVFLLAEGTTGSICPVWWPTMDRLLDSWLACGVPTEKSLLRKIAEWICLSGNLTATRTTIWCTSGRKLTTSGNPTTAPTMRCQSPRTKITLDICVDIYCIL